jgi:hypothetical protein
MRQPCCCQREQAKMTKKLKIVRPSISSAAFVLLHRRDTRHEFQSKQDKASEERQHTVIRALISERDEVND